MSEQHDLEILINGHIPIIQIETHEEKRALDLITRIATQHFIPIFRWTVTEGMTRRDIDLGAQKHVADPKDVLRHIKSSSLTGIYVLIDFHPYINDPINARLLKEIAMSFDGGKGKLVLMSPQLDLSGDLERMSARFQLRLPDANELEQLIKNEARLWQQQNVNRVRTDSSTLEQLVQNLAGLPANDAKRLIRNAIVDDGAITESDLPEVMQAKYKLLNQDNVIAFEYETTKFSEVGGMAKLKNWLKQRQPAFQGKVMPVGLDRPKGILLLGVQGCGKSLAAKAVAGIWGIPLLRMDFGNMYNKYVGETENNLRQALHTAEVMAPCVLWIDELEKHIAVGNEDEGTSRRLLGTLLTWMAENKKTVFIVATANQINSLPPELIRKGRLDEIFFVDLPDEDIRQQIFKIHFDKRNLETRNIDFKQLAEASAGFSGAEIEQAIVSVMYANLNDGLEIDTQDVLLEIQQTRPLSVVMAEHIAQLRAWASERTVSVD